MKSFLLLLVQSSLVSNREQCRDVASPFVFKSFHMNGMMYDKACTKSLSINGLFPLKPVGKGRVTLLRVEQQILLNHVVVVEFGPLKDVLLAHNV